MPPLPEAMAAQLQVVAAPPPRSANNGADKMAQQADPPVKVPSSAPHIDVAPLLAAGKFIGRGACSEVFAVTWNAGMCLDVGVFWSGVVSFLCCVVLDGSHVLCTAPCVVKRLLPLQDPSLLLSELNVLTPLRHPHIVQVLGYRCQTQVWFFSL
jgi:hypothetical protein